MVSIAYWHNMITKRLVISQSDITSETLDHSKTQNKILTDRSEKSGSASSSTPTALQQVQTEIMQHNISASEEINNLRKAIDMGYTPKAHTKQLHSCKKLLSELSIEEGLIMRGERIIVFPEIRSEIVKVAHESHLDAVKTKQLINETMWFPNIDEYVKLEIQNYLPCRAVNSIQFARRAMEQSSVRFVWTSSIWRIPAGCLRHVFKVSSS